MAIPPSPVRVAHVLLPAPLREQLRTALDTVSASLSAAATAMASASAPASAPASISTSASESEPDAWSPAGTASAHGAPQQATLSDLAAAGGRTPPGGTGPDPATKTGADADDRGDGDGDGADAAGSDTPAYWVPVERRPPCPNCGGVLAQELITEHRRRDPPLVYDGFWCSRCDTGFQQCPMCDQLHRPTAECPVAALRDSRE